VPASPPVIFTVVALTPPEPLKKAAPADAPDVVVPIVKVSTATVPENVIIPGATLVVRLLITLISAVTEFDAAVVDAPS